MTRPLKADLGRSRQRGMRALAGLVFVACLFAASPAHAADRVVVRFSRSADASDRTAARHAADATDPRSLPGLTGVQVVDVPNGRAATAARTLDRADGVEWAQPEHLMHVSTSLPSGPGSDSAAQWGLLNTGQTVDDGPGAKGVDGDFTPAWDTTTGAGQTIAVVDTGVDFSTIQDLAVNSAGSADFVHPSDCDAGTALASHATHVAGIAAASYGIHQSHDIVGGAPDAKILSLRALNGAGCGTDADIASAFAAAAAAGARVVNASLGGPGYSPVLNDAIASYPNTLFVVAAGNGTAQKVGYDQDAHGDYPCADPAPNVVCVAAVDNTGALPGFSNFGATSVDVGAPGVDIRSYVAGGTVQAWDGTSMATPFVSAAAALAFAANPNATPSQVRAAIIATAHPLDSLNHMTVSGGMIDAAALVKAVADLPPPQAPTPTPAPAAPAQPTTPATAPATKPAAAPASPKLSLHKPRRRGRKLAISGRVTRTFQRTVTIKACAGRRCRTVKVRARGGAFAVKLRPPRRGRIVVTASVPAGGGFAAARVRRTVRF